ncbi:MAG: hypothetical protein Tsb0032_44070 [Kiloniellaceae bacterium]
MPDSKRHVFADLILAGCVAAGAAALFIGAAELPPPRFEPLGSAALPRILGGLLLFFAAAVAVRAVLRWRSGAAPSQADAPETMPLRGLAVLLALLAYVFAMDVLRVPFVPATTLFVAAVGLSTGRRSWLNLGVFLALGLVLSLAISTILSRYLFITIN